MFLSWFCSHIFTRHLLISLSSIFHWTFSRRTEKVLWWLFFDGHFHLFSCKSNRIDRWKAISFKDQSKYGSTDIIVVWIGRLIKVTEDSSGTIAHGIKPDNWVTIMINRMKPFDIHCGWYSWGLQLWLKGDSISNNEHLIQV